MHTAHGITNYAKKKKRKSYWRLKISTTTNLDSHETISDPLFPKEENTEIQESFLYTRGNTPVELQGKSEVP